MKAHLALKTSAFLAFLLCSGCYVGNSDKSSESSSENTEFGDDAQVNAPDVNVVAGQDASVDASNRPDNSVSSDSSEPLDGVIQCADLSADGPGGFVFKPVSESDGNLAIVVPADFVASKLCADAKSDSEGEEAEEEEDNPVVVARTDAQVALGKECVEDAGTEPDEGRLVFRFSMPGAFYSSKFSAVTPDGICEFEIEDTAQRVDKRSV